MRKYEMTDDRHYHLRRIRATRSIPEIGVQAGDLGGWIESERNLAHDGACWVSVDAMVAQDAVVLGDAQVFGEAIVSGSALVGGEAQVAGDSRVAGKAVVTGKARVTGEAIVTGKARVFGSAEVFGKAMVLGSARVFGDAWVFGSARVFGDARVADEARVSGSARVTDEANVSDNAMVYGEAQVYGKAVVTGEAQVYGKAQVCGEARVTDEALWSGDAIVTGEEPPLPDYPGAIVASKDRLRFSVRARDRGENFASWLTTGRGRQWRTDSELLEWLGPGWEELTTPPESEWVPVDADQIRAGDFVRFECKAGHIVEGDVAADGPKIKFYTSASDDNPGKWFKREEQTDEC